MQEEQNATNTIFRSGRRQAHTERKVKAWIRSTTPEFDIVTGDDAVHPSQNEPQPRPAFRRAASSPYIMGRPYDANEIATSPPTTYPPQHPSQLVDFSLSHRYQSPERNEFSSSDYRNLDPYANGGLVPVRNGSLPESHHCRPSTTNGITSQLRLSSADSETPTKQPRRPNPFSRGFSAGDIHTVRLREIRNPSLSSIATHHTASSSGTRKSRPSLSNAFSMPRSEKLPEGVVVGALQVERKSPRKQPSLMKGLRGSFFGLLHKGEGDETRALRKESKADLRAHAMQPYAVQDQVAEYPILEGSGRLTDQETHHVVRKGTGLPPPSSTTRPHLRRSSNSAPDNLPRTRLFSPITLRQANAPSAWDSHNNMIASDSVESLTSPPRSSSLPKGPNDGGLPNIPLVRDKPLVRQFRSGSDTAAWEKRPNIPIIPHRNASNIARYGPLLVEKPSVPARHIMSHAKLLAPSSPEIRKAHRPRSQSWSAAQVLSAAPVQPLRLRKKRSEPILSSNVMHAAPFASEESETSAAADQLHIPQENDHDARRLDYLRVGNRPTQQSLHVADDDPLTKTIPPVHVSDIFASPTNSDTHRQEAAMKALEKALGAPTWADVDFHATSRESGSTTPRPISPKTNDRSSSMISPSISPHRTISVLKTPPRDPLPRAPSLSTPRRRIPAALNLTRTPDQPRSGPNKENQHTIGAYPPLPRLSYSFDKEAAGSRRSKTGPRLVSVIFPSSAPATKVDFDTVPLIGKQSVRETRCGLEVDRRDDSVDWEAKFEMVVRDLNAEREKRMKSESDLMRLHGKYLGAVKRISQ